MRIHRLFLSLLATLLFSCSLVSRKDIVSSADESIRTNINETTKADTIVPEAKIRPLSTLKKTIADQDLKKKEEDKELKKRVVVLPFLDRKNIRNLNVMKNAHKEFINHLNESDEMIALDPSVLKLDLTKYIKNNTYDMKLLAKDIQSAGVSCLLEGRVIDMRFKNEDVTKVDNSSSLKLRPVIFEVVVQARMLNIRSEQELFNSVKTITIEDDVSKISENITSENFFNNNPKLTELLISDAFMDFGEKLSDSLKYIVWEGRIAALQGEKIYINVGQISGVQVGDILKVVEDGNEVYDTELGYHLGKVSGKVKGTLEVIGFFGQDGAVSIIHSGAGFKENDRVELYQ